MIISELYGYYEVVTKDNFMPRYTGIFQQHFFDGTLEQEGYFRENIRCGKWYRWYWKYNMYYL